MRRKTISIVQKFIIFLVLFSPNLWAVTECQVKTIALYVGDHGVLWMEFANGGSAYIEPTDADFKNIYTLVLAAQMSDKAITVRYDADNVSCKAAQRSDVRGVWLYR